MLLFLNILIFGGCRSYYYDWDDLVTVVNVYYQAHRKKKKKKPAGYGIETMNQLNTYPILSNKWVKATAFNNKI